MSTIGKSARILRRNRLHAVACGMIADLGIMDDIHTIRDNTHDNFRKGVLTHEAF